MSALFCTIAPNKNQLINFEFNHRMKNIGESTCSLNDLLCYSSNFVVILVFVIIVIIQRVTKCSQDKTSYELQEWKWA